MHRMKRMVAIAAVLGVTVGVEARAADKAAIDAAIAKIKAVKPEGEGAPVAATAWKSLVGMGTDAIVPIMTGMDDANANIRNWLQSAAGAIIRDTSAKGGKVPYADIEAFLTDTKHSPHSRRFAFEVLMEADPKGYTKLLPGFVNDTSLDIRYAAIEHVFENAQKLEGAEAKTALKKLFDSARDQEQTEKIAKKLEKLEAKPDLSSHFGVVKNWSIIGPFDCPKSDIGVAFEPETKVDLSATLKGKGDVELKWTSVVGEKEYALVNFNKLFAEVAKSKSEDKEYLKNVVCYAFAVIQVEKDTPVDIRIGSQTAMKLFVNGKDTYTREEYHNGSTRFDQYVASTTLKAGKNEVLIKFRQNNQKEPWAQDWKFQCRICDNLGTAVPFTVVTGGK